MRFAPVLVALCALPAHAQVIVDMTPERIEQAIAAGAQRPPARYSVRSPQLWMEFDTPFLRVAQQGGAGPDRVAPEVHVVAAPELLSSTVPAIKAVLLELPDGSTVAPRSQTKYVEYAQAAKKKKIEIRGVRAVFPVAALQPGVRFRFEMDGGAAQSLALEPEWFKVPR